MADSRRTQTLNTFQNGMWQDSLLSQQREGTYREAWSGVMESDEANSFGIGNEPSNELFIKIPKGFDIRGIVYAEDRNQYVVFLYDFDKGFSEIGILDEKNQEYIKKVSDKELGGKLCFGDEFINLELKNTGQCNPLEVYWSNSDIYRYLDLDDKFICDKKLSDLDLFKCDCPPIVTTNIYENGGKLPNGVYQFFIGLEDEEGNDTNYFTIGDPVSIGSDDFIAGEPSSQSILISLKGFVSRYPKVRLGVVKTIGGKPTVDLITTAYHGNGNFSYIYRSTDQVERELDIREVLTRKDGYIKGKGISQFDGRLLLFNTRGKLNLDYQRRANKIKASYVKYRVPLKFAHQFKGLRPWEKYWFAMHFNFCDCTRTSDYIISGRESIPSDLVPVPADDIANCSLCDLPWWRVYDTSNQTDLFGEDSKTLSKKTKRYPNYTDDGYKYVDRKPKTTDDSDDSTEQDLDKELDCECGLLETAFKGMVLECDECDVHKAVATPGFVEKWCACLSHWAGDGGDHEPELPVITINGQEVLNINLTEEEITLLEGDPDLLETYVAFLSCASSGCGSSASETSTVSCNSCGGTGTCYTCGGDGTCHTSVCQAVEPCDPESGSTCETCSGSGTCSTCAGSGDIAHASWYQAVKSYEEDRSKLLSDFTTIEGHRAIRTNEQCACEGETVCDATICQTCKNGYWYTLDHVDPVRNRGRFYREIPVAAPEPIIQAACIGDITVALKAAVCTSDKSWEVTIDAPSNIKKLHITVTSPNGNFSITRNNVGSSSVSFTDTLDTSGFSLGDEYRVSASFTVELENGCKYSGSFTELILLIKGNSPPCRDEVVQNFPPDDPGGGGGGGGNGGSDKAGPCNDLTFEYVYDEDGCEIIGVKPLKYAEGTFGFWETQEEYPLTKDCNGEYIYGELAGAKVRLHAVPGNLKEPHFLSCQNGVPNEFDPANSEFDKTYIDFVGVKFEGIERPLDSELSKPLCPYNPFTITMVPRDEANITVLSSGIFISTFKGEVHGEQYAFPKHAVNSCEYYDRSIEPGGASTFRGGVEMDKPVYIHHSPDCNLLKRSIGDSYHVKFDLELNGSGFRYHHYAEGETPESPTLGRKNQKGTTQNIHLNHYDETLDVNGIVRCVKSADYAEADRVLAKGDDYSYSLVNLWRESSVYLELEGNILPMRHAIDADFSGSNYGGRNPLEDRTSDASFLGDTRIHESPIYHANSFYGHLVRYLPNQYGNPVGQSYIPLLQGNTEDMNCGTIEGLSGDSFCNTFTVKRTGFVSDKVPEDISPALNFSGGPIIRFFKNVLKGIFNSIGIEDCGTVPKSAEDDVRTNDGKCLRPTQWAPDPQNPNVPPLPNPTGSDIYYPALLKTNITTYTPSDANTHFRQTADEFNGEAYYSNGTTSRLKSLFLDSRFPVGIQPEKAWLDRFYMESNENPAWKMVVRVIINFLFTYGIGLWIIIKGLGMLGGGSWALQTAFAILVIAAGIFWIIFWAGVDWDNKLWDKVIGIDGCWPDLSLPDGAWKMRDGRVKGFEDNYWKYNLDYTLLNSLETSRGLTDPYNTCPCLGDYQSKIIYSAKQRLGSPVNSWLNFKIADYDEVPTDAGKITDLFQLGNRMYVHTTDTIIDLLSGNSELTISDRDKIFLSNGDLFRDAIPLYGGIQEGKAGCPYPNSSATTDWGHFFIDPKSKTIYVFDGSRPVAISDLGLRYFLHDNLDFKLLEQFPEFKHVDNKHNNGIGHAIGVDHKLNRILITKIDYEAYEPEALKLAEQGTFFYGKNNKRVLAGDPKYFCNRSFTVSFNPINKHWISKHYYHPKLYTWNRFDLYTYDKDGMWIHNVKGDYGSFYGEYYPFSVEYVINDANRDAFSYVSSKVDADFSHWKDYDYIRNSKLFFDKLLAYNSHQSTGEVTFRDKSTEDIMSATAEVADTVQTSFRMRKWNFDGLRDKLTDISEHILDNECTIGPRQPNKQNLSVYKNNKLVDNYLVNRLIFSKFEQNIKIALKSVEHEIEREVS